MVYLSLRAHPMPTFASDRLNLGDLKDVPEAQRQDAADRVRSTLGSFDLDAATDVVPADYSEADLEQVEQSVRSDLRGSSALAIGISPKDNAVLVFTGENESPAARQRLLDLIAPYGEAARLSETMTAQPRPTTACGPRTSGGEVEYVCDRPLHGAVAIDSSLRNCSSGFLAHSSSITTC